MVVLGAMVVQLDHWDFLLVEFLSPRRFRATLCTDSVSPRVPSALAVSARSFQQAVSRRSVGLVKVLLVLLSFQVRFLSSCFAAWLKARSRLLLLITGFM